MGKVRMPEGLYVTNNLVYNSLLSYMVYLVGRRFIAHQKPVVVLLYIRTFEALRVFPSLD